MANWWEDDPVVSQEEVVPQSGNFWESDPEVMPLSDLQAEDREQKIGLPLPHTAMFEGLDEQKSKLLADSYNNHPDTQEDELGRKTYKGVVIPFPEGRTSPGRLIDAFNPLTGGPAALIRDQDVSTGQQGVGNIIDLGKNLATTGLAVGDFLGKGVKRRFMGSENPEANEPTFMGRAAEALNKGLGETNPGNTMDEVWKEGQQVAAGAVLGGGAVKGALSATKASGSLPKFFQGAAKFLGGEAGIASAVDEDTQTLVTGDNAMLKVWAPVALDENGAYSDELLKKRLGILADGIMVGAGVQGVAKGTGFVGNFLKEITWEKGRRFFSDSKMAENFAGKMADQLAGITNHSTNEEQYAARMGIARLIEENKDVVVPVGQKQLDQGINDATFQRDTFGAAIQGMDPDLPTQMRAGFRAKGTNKLETKLMEPDKALGKLYDESQQAFGGQKALDDTRKSIQGSGLKEVGQAHEAVEATKNAITDAESGVESLLRDDPTFGPTLQRLGKKVNLDIYGQSKKAAKDIVQNILKASDTMTTKKNELYAKIPGGANNSKQFVDTILKKAESIGVSNETIEKLKKAKFNYRNRYKVANFELLDEISRARTSGEYQKANALRDLHYDITEKGLDDLNATADEPTRKAVEAAKKYYAEEYAPFWRQGKLQEIQDLARDKLPFKNAEFADDSRNLVLDTVRNPRNEEQNKLVQDMLKRPEGGGSAKSLTDILLGDIAGDIAPKLDVGKKLSDDAIETISARAREHLPFLDKSDRLRVENFLTKLKTKNVSVDDLKATLEDAEQTLKETEKKVFQQELPEFFDRGTKAPKQGSYQIFDQIFRGDNAPERIKNLSDRDFTEKGGAKVAFFKYLKQNIFRDGKPEKGINEKFFSSIDKDKSGTSAPNRIMEVGEKLLTGEDKPLLYALEELQKQAGKHEETLSSRTVRTIDTSQVAKDAREASGFIVTQTLGVLNTIGARVRAAAGQAITNMDRDEVALRVLDELAADPDKFLKDLKSIAGKDRNKMSKPLKDLVWKVVTRTGILSTVGDADREKYQKDLDKIMLNETARNLGTNR